MSRTVLVLVVVALILSLSGVCAAETRMIDGIEMTLQENSGAEFPVWTGSYSFMVVCNTCTGIVTCDEKIAFYECRQSDFVACTLLACESATPIHFVPKEFIPKEDPK